MASRDHFDQKVEASLRRDIPIITTPHARVQLTNKGGDSFTNVSALHPFETGLVEIGGTGGPKRPLLRVTGMPGKHVPSNAVVGLLNKMANAVSTVLPAHTSLKSTKRGTSSRIASLTSLLLPLDPPNKRLDPRTRHQRRHPRTNRLHHWLPHLHHGRHAHDP